MTDEKVIAGILAGGGSLQRTIDWFYRENFNLVYKMTGSHKLPKEEVMDAYSDALTAFVNNVRFNKFRGESKCSTYFIRIFNNKCIDVIRKKTTNKATVNTIFLEDMKHEMMEPVEKVNEVPDIAPFINELSEVCREVLMDWSDGFSMDEVAERNGLKNAHTARSKRYNCFQQLMEILKHKNIVDANLNLLADGD